MRILFLPDGWTILLCFVLWPILQLTAEFICHRLPDRFYDERNFFFQSKGFEKEGAIYDQIFHVRKWKHLLPDGGMVRKKRGFRKKRLEQTNSDHLERFILESSKAELIHWLGMFPFWVFGFFTSPNVVLYMFLYALAVNMPCIIVQRYNRPRVQHLLNRKRKKESQNQK